MVGHFLDVLYIADRIVFIDYKNGTHVEPEFFDQYAVGFTKMVGFVVGQCHHAIDIVRATPATLCKRQVDTDGEDDDVITQVGCFFIEPFRLRITNAGSELRNDAE